MAGGSDLQVIVLGPLKVRSAGVDHEPSALQKRLLGLLALTPRRSVRVEALHDALWGPSLPRTARAALQNQVSRLRKAHGRTIIDTTSDGYLLNAVTDLDELRSLIEEAEALVGPDPAGCLDRLRVAQALVRGEPFGEVGHLPAAIGIRVEVAELVDSAADLSVRAHLDLGHVARALPEAARLHADRPLDEQRVIRLVQAHALAGRRGDALTTIAGFRRSLRSELGLQATAAFDDLEAAVLGGTGHVPPEPPRLPDGMLSELVDAVTAGRHATVSGPPGSGVSTTLRALRRRVAQAPGAVALAEVGGLQDVAVAPLLDLLDELGMRPDGALGPVGSFAPMIRRAAGRAPVVLVVDDTDKAGPSTRMALSEVARIDHVTLVLGSHSGRVLELATEVDVVLPACQDPRVSHRRTLAAQPDRVLLCLAATEVAGRDVALTLLEELGSAAGLDEAIAAGLLRLNGRGRVEFCDGGLRDLVHHDTPAGLRTELHHAMGRALARNGTPTEAAHHLLAAVQIEPRAAIEQARQAAELARAAGAHHDAAHWLQTALERSGELIPDELALRLTIELGDALRLSGDRRHLEVLHGAIELADKMGNGHLLNEALFALLQLGGTTVNAPLAQNVASMIERAAHAVAQPAFAAPMRAAASLAYSLAGDASHSSDMFRRAERDAQGPATRRRVLPFAYMALSHPDDLAERRRLGEELLTLADEYDDPAAEFEAWHLLFPVSLQTGDGEGVRAIHSRMTELVDRVGDVGRRWSLLYQGAALAHLDDDLRTADDLSQSAYALFSPVSEPRASAVLYGQLFGLSIARDDVTALTPFLEVLAVDQPGVPAWNAALGLALASTDPVRAIRHCTVMLDSAQRDSTWLVSHLVGGRAAALVTLAGGPCDGSILERYRAALAPYGHLVSWQGTCSYGPVATTSALLARAVGDDAAAQAHHRTARTLAEGLSAPCFLADLNRIAALAGLA